MEASQNSDSRLLRAYTSIETGEIALLSLDLFDTLVWRKLPCPEDLFLLLGRQLKEEGWLIPAVTMESFAELRKTAEMAARREKAFIQNTEEVTLTEIYWRLEPLFIKLSLEQIIHGETKGLYESDVSLVVKKELALEKALLQPDIDLLKLFTLARQKNIQVILVSDTYFEEAQIKELLENHLPLHEISTLFLSSEYGCSKKKGLFKAVLEEMQLPPDKILHIGDKETCDVLPARELGMRTIHYFKQDAKLNDIFEREWPKNLSKRCLYLDNNQGDFGISALRSKISHHCEIEKLHPDERFFWNYGATVLAPVLLGFVHWIYERCQDMQQETVYCLMREGRLYARLIQRYSECYKQHPLKTKELWVSRLFITHAALFTASKKELKAVMKAFLEHFTVEQFCVYLGIDLQTLPKWHSQRHLMLEEEVLQDRLIHDLLSNPSLIQLIVEKANTKRERFLKYLSTLAPLEETGQLVLVDIGWNGTAQIALHEILQWIKNPSKLHGLYLGTTENVCASLLRGNVSEGFLFKGGYPFYGNAHKKGCFVLEQTATAETGVGPLADISPEGEILNHPFLIPEKQKKQSILIQKGIFAFFDYACGAIKRGALHISSQSEPWLHQLRSIFLRSMLNPTQTEASKFGHWKHEHGPFQHLTQVIGKNSYYDTYIKDMLPVAAFKESRLNWPAAYTAKQSKYLTLTSEAMWLKTLPPECFLSQDSYPLKIFVDTGRDFSQKATQVLELRSNPNRQFFALTKLSSTKKPIERIQLVFAFPPSLVRIHTLRISVYDAKHPVPQELCFFESTQVPKIEMYSRETLSFNTFYCEEPLKMIYTLPSQNVYQIDFKLCCEMFPIKKDS